MNIKHQLRLPVRLFVAGAGLAAGTYAVLAAAAWFTYGRPPRANAADHDELLDGFMPEYDVVERHRIEVDAPARIVLAASKEQDLFRSTIVRSIFRTRELVLGAAPETRTLPRSLFAQVQALGWGVLSDVPDREVVVGAITKPWEANVSFHALRPEEFAAFDTAGWVKIAWTLRADRIDADRSVFRTETRAVATDGLARARFRRYWALASPGIATIRHLSLRPLKNEAERRATLLRVESADTREHVPIAGADVRRPDAAR